MSFNFAILINFYKKDFGDKESLKINYQFSKAIEINFLIKKYNINTFSLSENLINFVKENIHALMEETIPLLLNLMVLKEPKTS